MTDIDFDELDRAVNSLMQPKQANQPSQQLTESTKGDSQQDDKLASDSRPVATSPAKPTSEPKPSSDDDVPAPKDPLATQPSDPSKQASSDSRPKVEVKKRGQFMDIVRTSSGVKPAASPAPKLAPRRQGALLQPSTSDASLTTEPVKPVESMTETKPTDDTVEPSPAAKSWPDPIDTEENQLTDNRADKVAETEPLSSPFLADAKVDKRPLGGLQPTTELAAEPVADPEVATPPASQTEDTTILPEELGQDILAVEAAANTTAVNPTEPAITRPASTPPTTPVEPPSTASVGSLPQGPPPQVAGNSDTEPGSSIFDTEHYQAPIKHPVKRKSSWPIVLAIVMLVLLGTGGGIAFYLLSSGY